MANRRASWHLEKGVSISIILALLIQIAGFGVCAMKFVWFASEITKQVEQNTSDINVMKTDEKDREKTRAEMLATLTGIRQELTDMRTMMFQSANHPTQLILPSATGAQPPQVILNQAAPASPDRLSMPNAN
jgi:hypothetical protein